MYFMRGLNLKIKEKAIDCSTASPPSQLEFKPVQEIRDGQEYDEHQQRLNRVSDHLPELFSFH